MSVEADDTYDVYHERPVRARKAHKCIACREVIAPGHRYWRIGVIYDGSARTLRRCLRCQCIHVHLRELCSSSDDYTWPDEWLGCGQSYEAEWGKCPEHIAVLAFVSGADLQSTRFPRLGKGKDEQ